MVETVPVCDCEQPDVVWADIDEYWQCLYCGKIQEDDDD